MKHYKVFSIIFIFSMFLGISLTFSCKSTPVAEESKKIAPVVQSEYERSVGNIQTDEKIPFDTFEADKKNILKAINDLTIIMNAKDFYDWLNYITPESKAYWSQRSNLKAVSSRLPVKSITLKSLEDYFKFFFCPSRQGKRIDEIRYISSTYVKAVQVSGNQDIIYYTFVKRNDKWLVELDKLE